MGPGKSSVLVLAQVRRFHVYLAMLAAPTLIFFSATGMLQLFSLHEAHGDYHPPVLLQKLAALHKDQVFTLQRHLRASDGVAATPSDDDHHDDAALASTAEGDRAGGHKHHADGGPRAGRPKFDKTAHWTAPQIALKGVLALTSTAALISTLLGVWMGFITSGKNRLQIACFVLGLAAPLALILMVAG